MSDIISKFEICQKSSSGQLQEINGSIEAGTRYVAVITRQSSTSSIFIGAIKLYEQTPGYSRFVADFISPASCVAETDVKPDEQCTLNPPTSTTANRDTIDLYDIPIGLLKSSSSYTVELTFGTSAAAKFGELRHVSPTDSSGRPAVFTVMAAGAPQPATGISIANVATQPATGTSIANAPIPAVTKTADDGRITTVPGAIGIVSTSAIPTQSTLANNPGVAPTTGSTSTLAAGPASTSILPAASSSSSGLSTGAKAGIGVGVGIAVLAALLLAFLLLLRRKRTRRAATYATSPDRSEKDLHAEKELGVISAAPAMSGAPVVAAGASYGVGHDEEGAGGDAADAGRSRNGEVVRKPVGEGVGAGTVPATMVPAAMTTAVLSEEERARWEEEERRLDEDIAEAERRRLAQ